MTCTLENTCAVGLTAIRLTSLPPCPSPHGRGLEGHVKENLNVSYSLNSSEYLNTGDGFKLSLD